MGEAIVDPRTECELVEPDAKNLHYIEALEPCALLDVILPPYSDANPCNYYIVDESYAPSMLRHHRSITRFSLCWHGHNT